MRCPNGELFKYIIENKKLGEENAKIIFKEIVAGLAYVHSLNIAHRDLKPENILLSETNHIKITDFGFSRYVGENGWVKTSCGSPCYASPECISGEQYDGIKSDMWSIGVILFAMVTGMLPWTKRNKNALFKQIQQAKYRMPQNISPE
ncbi:serine/threonine kinase family [Trichomonas vaginalis G3]|uniref:serine/threonine kinase family n=1 Tax=Trichomonas vaginalis (strain ATCC PRA-98 / G3) TaxID=412133 RepID=UPI0021E61A86|nr:serine/threonine kinase family [Trichomonas vaginalis G3]KAI5529944.1 serine/threonine kinase family [Trichomonas vaginalis G3]